ncbi:hypothetical protein RvY_07252 [Ramazzottius varieornatus]|uniref:Uncharacterized protein n=1 Tax=Ramazzottius varieornatus TaxID=947166 RepID=A0A1D1V1F2_RAMVA|nr:hypothetical protein RvY_07252 [Ramazzottius varieornatus]
MIASPAYYAYTLLVLLSLLRTESEGWTVKKLAGHTTSPSLDDTSAITLQTKLPAIAHTLRRHNHPHTARRNHTAQSTQRTKTRTTSFSQNLLHELQVHLGLRLATTTPHILERKMTKSRSPRVMQNPTTPGQDELQPLGAPIYANSHVPFRYRYKYSTYYYPVKALPADLSETSARTVDPCMLARWNFELPFSELPNMAAGLLANDMVSGESTTAKARFIAELLRLSLDSYVQMESSGDVFEIPQGFDLSKCNFKKSEDPLSLSVNHLLKLYAERSATSELLLDLVKASKACLGSEDRSVPLELLGCVDFSFGSEQVLQQQSYRSIFANDEICRRYLQPNFRDCLPLETHPCNTDHIETLNTFARFFYLCPDLGNRSASVSTSGAFHPASHPDGASAASLNSQSPQALVSPQLLTLALALASIALTH